MTPSLLLRFLPALTLFVLAIVLLPNGGVASPRPVAASECIIGGEEGGGEDSGTLLITFREGSADGPQVALRGFRVTISPNPITFVHTGSFTATDDGFGDDDDGTNAGQIVIDDACQTDHVDFPPGGYTLTASIVPASQAETQGCTISVSTLSGITFVGGDGAVLEINFPVFCTTTASARPPASAMGGGAAATGSTTAAVATPRPAGAATTGAVPVAAARTVEMCAVEVAEVVSTPPPLTRTTFEVSATGDEVVPGVSNGGEAFGRFTFDPDNGHLDFAVTVSKISSNLVSGAHLHSAAAGENGPTIHVISDESFAIASGTLELSEDEQNELLAGNYYLTVESKDHPGGFARAQLQVPEPEAAPAPAPEPVPCPVLGGGSATVSNTTPAGSTTIRPPNTGEGGLLSASGGPSASVLVIVSLRLLLGTTALTNSMRRSR